MASGTHRAGRSRRWLLPVAVLLLWLFVGGPLSGFAGQLGSIQENDNAAFLPQSAESTRALEKLVRFQDEDTLPAVVVAERDGGLTDQDTALLQQYAEQLADVPGLAASGVSGPIPSADGDAAQLVVNLDARDGDALLETVGEVREVVAEPPAGLTVLVGGQGGILGDFIEAFGAIDGLLLGVALLVVLVILLVVYRTPVLPLVVIFSSVLALGVASAAVYGLARADVLDVNGQSQGILFILAIGAATDYSLLVVSRFREELRDHESRFTAMGRALRASWEPVVASGLTVVLGLLCLLLSDLSSLAGLGPVGALGIVGAVLASLTLLPAMLVLLGRVAFWPFMPTYGSEHRDERGAWGRVARLVGRRAPAVAVVTALALGVLAVFITTLDEDPVPQTELFLTEVDSVRAQEVIDDHFESDASSPVQVVVPAALVGATVDLLQDHPGIARPTDRTPTVFALPASPDDPTTPKVVDGEAVVLATLDAPGDSAAATATLELLRTDLHALDDGVLVGGSTAILVDTRETTQRDRAVVIPAILLVILVVLALLLRSLVAPLLLILANVLSFGATMGVSALVFEHVFDYPASDPSTSLIAFVFLVALGIDYSIFLMTRVREESLRRGTRPGILKGLSVTGGVITSAGVVLAATFTALGVIPILFLAQIAFIVAFGVLLDALVVRSLLVPALCHWIGPRIWWPSGLARRP
ncbi:MMPL family transporter [Nocardioides aurantiacus]|uniref:MMPL family transporter n=1 Tax=Nocardioides aurantiacus TaxID=86796 RepID=UPI00403FC114